MKKITITALLTGAIYLLTLLSVNAQFDNLYYNPNTESNQYNSSASYSEDDYEETNSYGYEYDDEDYYEDEDYYDEYDYYYTSRIKRFHRYNRGFDFYDPFYTDYYYYDPFGYSPSTSIYISFGSPWSYRYRRFGRSSYFHHHRYNDPWSNPYCGAGGYYNYPYYSYGGYGNVFINNYYGYGHPHNNGYGGNYNDNNYHSNVYYGSRYSGSTSSSTMGKRKDSNIRTSPRSKNITADKSEFRNNSRYNSDSKSPRTPRTNSNIGTAPRDSRPSPRSRLAPQSKPVPQTNQSPRSTPASTKEVERKSPRSIRRYQTSEGERVNDTKRYRRTKKYEVRRPRESYSKNRSESSSNSSRYERKSEPRRSSSYGSSSKTSSRSTINSSRTQSSRGASSTSKSSRKSPRSPR